jgi:uncharacterized protein (TIGR02099 family)
MAALLQRLRLALIGITASVLILLAVLVTVLRLVLPMAADYREQVAGELGALLGHPVQIGALDARWHLLGPRVYLNDVAILGEEGEPALLQVQRLDLGVHLWDSLWYGQLRFHSVRVLGADVHVTRDADGKLNVSGAAMAAMEEAPSQAHGTRVFEMLAGTTFRLQSSRLRYTDQLLDLDYRLDDLNLDVGVESDALRLAGEVFLPAELGRVLTVGVDLRGDPESMETWRGQFHLRGKGIVIDRLPDESLARRVNANSGILDLELWGHIAAGRVDRVRARVRAEDVRLGAPASDAADVQHSAHLQKLDADALWEQRGPDGWQLRLHHARMRHVGGPEVEMGLSLVHRRAGEQQRFWGEAEGLRLDQLLPLLLSQDLLSDTQRDLLAALRPAGELPQLRFHGDLSGEDEPRFAAVGEFRELALEPHERFPGFNGVSGSFSVYHDGGEVSLQSRNVRLDMPRLFADSLWVDAVDATVVWERMEDGHRVSSERLRVHNEDLRAEGRLVVDLGPEPRMELEVDFADGDGSRTARYLPVGIMPPTTYQWLSRSIVEGRVLDGRLVFRGPLKKFPLDENEGLFEVRARVADGVLDYQPGWPAIREMAGELIFDDRGMRAESASGRLFDARIHDARVRIVNYRAAELEVEGQVEGPLTDMLRYVRESPLARGLDRLLDDTQAEGDSTLSLSLLMPLHRAGGGVAATRVKGAVELDDNRVRLVSQPVDFNQARGVVNFTEATVSAEGVTALLNGETITLAARMPAKEALTVRAEGMQPVSALETHVPEFLRPHLRGRALWTAELTVPHGGGTSLLRLNSMLEGVRSDLPAPLAKTVESRIPLQVEVPLASSEIPVRIRYGDILSAVLLPTDTADGVQGELRFNDGEARMPERGLRLAGRIDRLSVDAWRAVLDDTPTDAALQTGRGVVALDLYLTEMSTGTRLLREVQLNATRGPERWQARVDAPALRGQIDIPRDFKGVAPLTLNLELLDLDQMAAPTTDMAPERQRLDPREMPGIRGGIARLVFDGRAFRDVRIEATRIRDGLQIHYLQVDSAGGHAKLRVTGDWRVLGSGQHQTQLRFDLTTGHVGRMLTDLGFQHGFDRGEGRLEGQLRWPDAPTHFTWSGLQGTGRVDMDNGRLVEVEPGAGRLLGLFSLDMLPRRLSLDFRDVFQRGFLFDKLSGTVHLVGSDAYTSDLTVRGVAATVRIEGRSGLVVRDHDQRIVVTPRLGGTLPMAGVILGGPVAGAAVFILDRVLGVGRSIDEASRVEYRVTGSWQEPVVETLARPAEPQAERNP